MRAELLVDLLIAAVLAAIVLIISPGLAVTGILALAAVLVCAVSFLVGAGVRRRRSHRRRISPGRGGLSR